MSKLDENIIEAAVEWLLLLDDEAATEQTRQNFHTWLKKDAAHHKAFEFVRQTWDELDYVLPIVEMKDEEDAAAMRGSDVSVESGQHKRVYSQLWATPLWAKAAISTGLAASFALLVSVTPIPTQIQQSAVTYETAIGKIDSVVLPDDSTMFINSGTRLSVEYSNQSRVITLMAGEAHFDVATDAERPFSVIAGGRVVQAIGTAFSVRQTGSDNVTVIVSEGRVLMRNHVDGANLEDIVHTQLNLEIEASEPIQRQAELRDAARKERILRAGDRLEIQNDELSLISDIPVDKLERDLAWRHGGLIFDHDRLEDVINVISLYTDADIVIQDPELKALEVGGYFKIDDIDSMLNLLEVGLEVDVERMSQNRIEIRQR